MIVFFTEIEEQYVNKRLNRWTIKDDCPDDVKPILKRKLDYYYDSRYKQGGKDNGKGDRGQIR